MCEESFDFRHQAGPARRPYVSGWRSRAVPRQLAVAALVVGLSAANRDALAQQPVGAGGQIQQVPAVPVPEKPVPNLPVPPRRSPAAPEPGGAAFAVKSLHVTGQTRFSEAELIAAAEFAPGGALTLADLQAMASRIGSYYNQHGYFVAQAYPPPQDITDGAVTIAVIEGRYGQIVLQNHTPVADVVFSRVLDGLGAGDLVDAAPLERRLLIVSDIPGVVASSTLAPGAAVGTSDLTVSLAPGPRVSGSVEADNAGNPYTGAYRLGGSVTYAEPLGIGDALSLRVLASTTGGLVYGRAAYQAQVQDATVGVALTSFYYDLGKKFSDLNAHGTEEIASVYASYPLIRSYSTNLNAMVDFDERLFQDDIGAASLSTGKRASVLTVELSGDHRDTFGGGGLSTYSVAGTVGDLDIETAAARAADADGGRTGGGYAKLSGAASRLQQLIGPLSLYGSVRGQIASKNLDISEKMELGGANGVRAFPEGEAYGDQGYIVTLEARLLLPKWPGPVPGQVQLIAFADTGYVTVNQSAYGRGRNDLDRSGVGVGAVWFDTNNFAITATYAHMIGGSAATSYPDNSGEFWIQLVKYF